MNSADCRESAGPTLPLPARVVVLMSTYNGQQYIVEQIRSILDQLPPRGRLLVRDDGSADVTKELIAEFSDARIELRSGENVGFGASFLQLLADAPADADLVMFADQDDVWLPDKILRAWQALNVYAEAPALYGSAQMLVDAQLRRLHATPPWPRGPSFTNALTENIITGCTAALNRPAFLLLQRAGVPEGVYFHDWWLYLVVSAFGTVIYDDQPSILYRQHGANVIGHGAGIWGRHMGVLRFLLRHDWVGILLSQVAAFLRVYGPHLPSSRLAFVERYFRVHGHEVSARWRLVWSATAFRQARVGDLALRLLLAAHKLHLWPLPGRRR